MMLTDKELSEALTELQEENASLEIHLNNKVLALQKAREVLIEIKEAMKFSNPDIIVPKYWPDRMKVINLCNEVLHTTEGE